MTEQDTPEITNSPERSNSPERANSPEPSAAPKYATGRYVIVVIAMLICASVFYRSFQTDDEKASVSIKQPMQEAPVSSDVTMPVETPQPVDAVISQDTAPVVTPTPSFKVAEERKNTRQRLVDVVLTPAQQQQRVELAKQQAESEERVSDAKLKMLETRLSPDHDELESLSRVEVSYAVEQWRNAWSQGDSERYFRAYSESFTPLKQQDLDAWKASRQSELSPDKPVELSLSDFTVSFDEAMTTGTVLFKQTLGAKTTRKQLVLAKEASSWKIVSESLVNQSR